MTTMLYTAIGKQETMLMLVENENEQIYMKQNGGERGGKK